MFWQTMNTNDFQAASRLLSDAYRLEYPQSGEIFHGRDSFVHINEDYPASGLWRFTVHKLVAEGPEIVSDVSVTDSVAKARVITFSTVAGGLMVRQREFWSEPFEAPKWRRAWTQNPA